MKSLVKHILLRKHKTYIEKNKNFILGKLRKLYQERDRYIEQYDNDRKKGLLPWGFEIAIIQIENEIKEFERLLSNEKSN